MLEILKEQVITVAKEAERLGMCRHKPGNFDIFDPETGYAVITPSGMVRNVPGTEHICVTDLWGKVIEKAVEVKPSSEAVIHLYVYRERKDIRVIIHTHARCLTAFSIMNKPTMPIVYECAYLGKTRTVLVAPYGRVGAMDPARKTVGVIKEYDCCLIENHGAIVADKDMDTIFLKAQYVGEAAKMYYITLAAENGAELRVLPVEELQRWAYPGEIVL